MESQFHVPDIQCDGCANSIKQAVGRLGGINGIDVNVQTKQVTVIHDERTDRSAIADALDRAGFPVQS